MNTKKRPFVCFVHIERAGGTSLHHLLRNIYPAYVSLPPRYNWTNESGNYFSPKQLKYFVKILPFTSGIGGHTTRFYLNYENVLNRPVFYFTFLREPISRYMSHLNFQRQVKNIDWDLKEFINEPRFNNFQTIRIAGKPDLELAKDTIQKKVNFIGLMEQFDKSLLIFSELLGLTLNQVRYKKKNEGKTSDQTFYFDKLSKDVQNKILDNNNLDIELYQFTKEEIFPKFISNYNKKLEQELQKFRQINNGFHFPPGKQWSLRIFKSITRYGVEPLTYFMSR